MALFSMRMQVIKRSERRSLIAAVAYRAAEKLTDERQGVVHDYARRGGVERTELLFPTDAPGWVQGISREAFWNRVDAAEKRKDAQTARELRLMIPRELPEADRISVVRNYVRENFVSRGMVADIAWHNKTASDSGENVHCHVMLTLRPLTSTGFGRKSRHEMVPDPSGRTQADGRPVLVASNPDSWNRAEYYEECRLAWETTANDALARVGSAERIDRRSYLERGLVDRIREPALQVAWYMKALHGRMMERFGQFQAARHYRAVEARAKAALGSLDAPLSAPVEGRRDATPADRLARYFAWFDRQLERLAPAPTQPGHAHADRAPARASPRGRISPDLER